MAKKIRLTKSAIQPLADWKALANLDVKDRKLLWFLSKNYRLPYTFLAEQIGLSKDSVKYRIQKLEQAGLILSKTFLVNPVWIGHEYVTVFLSFQNLTMEKEQSLVQFFLNHPATNIVYRLAGKWQIWWGIDARDLIELDEFLNDCKIACGTYLKEYEILPASKEYKWANLIPAITQDLNLGPLMYSKNDFSFEKDILSSPPLELRHGQGIALTSIELDLISALNENSNITADQLCVQLNLSKDTVRKLIQKLIYSGAANAFWPFFNYKKLGLETYVMCIKLKYLNESWDQKLTKFIQNHPWIRMGVKVIGSWDVLLEIPCKNTAHFYELLDEFREEFSEIIQTYESFPIADYLYFNATRALINNERRPKQSWLQPKL
ncbi:MAG: Lrp/AsnC family transcriptional regulator [Candidatus Diapherotrites archaeon]|nr:Lrp/AsnC family transcriptional regulator [Candidatus Diapherotrites archaeon]